MTKKKKIIWLVIGIILAVIVAGIVYRAKNPKIDYTFEEVQRGQVSQMVSVTAELVSEEEIDLNFEVSGRIKEIRAWIGKEVTAGEVLAIIDDEVLNQQLTQAKAAWDKAVADAGVNNDAVREAQQSVDNAEDYYDEVDDLEDQKVVAAEQDYDNASDYYNEALSYYNKIVDEDGADSSEAKYAKLTLTTADNNKKAAEEALETARKSRDLSKTSADNSLKTAKESLKTAESDYARRSRNASVDSAKAGYEIALANLEKASLKAPVTGVITKVNYKSGEILGSASLGDSFGKMISEDFLLEADIPESDIAKVKVGQNAEVVFDAFTSDEKFQAEVLEIEPGATVIQDVIYYKVKLKLKSFDSRLKEGMSADVDIMIAEKDNVLKIPERIIKRNGSKEVKVMRSDKTIEEVEVTTGLKGDDGMIEITSGLEEGDQIIVEENV